MLSQFVTLVSLLNRIQMTRPRAQPAVPPPLPPADANLPPPLVLPPQVHVPPPVAAAVIQPQLNNQPARTPPPGVTPPPAAPSAAQSLASRLIDLSPTMTIDQLTGILDILNPDRHTRTVASTLLRLAQPPPPLRSAPAPASAPNQPPPPNPLTGARIVTPQRRAQPAPQHAPARSLLDVLTAPTCKRSGASPLPPDPPHVMP